jgi:hypothetical protein
MGLDDVRVGVAVVIALAAASSAEAQGFNVNTDVTLTPLVSTYQTTTSNNRVPGGIFGKVHLYRRV